MQKQDMAALSGSKEDEYEKIICSFCERRC